MVTNSAIAAHEAGPDSGPGVGADAAPVLAIENLHVEFRTRGGVTRAVNGVSLRVARGETLAVVGESGSGKSVTSLAAMRLLPSPPARVASGAIRHHDLDLLALPEAAMRAIRGNRIAMIFQEPMTSLDPVMTVGRQIAEAIEVHQRLSRAEALEAAVRALELVRVPEPRRRAAQYPFQLSGGLRQRVMIAMAMSCAPELLIADEPTTALDVTIQAQILWLMRDLQARTGTAILLITHDLGVVAEMADRVAVMYAGRIVEQAAAGDLFDRPRHPYTLGLMGAAPRLGAAAREPGARLREIPGLVPSLREEIAGCAFAPRCPLATPRCTAERPPFEVKAPAHLAACWESGRVGAAA